VWQLYIVIILLASTKWGLMNTLAGFAGVIYIVGFIFTLLAPFVIGTTRQSPFGTFGRKE